MFQSLFQRSLLFGKCRENMFYHKTVCKYCKNCKSLSFRFTSRKIILNYLFLISPLLIYKIIFQFSYDGSLFDVTEQESPLIEDNFFQGSCSIQKNRRHWMGHKINVKRFIRPEAVYGKVLFLHVSI